MSDEILPILKILKLVRSKFKIKKYGIIKIVKHIKLLRSFFFLGKIRDGRMIK